MKHRRTWNERVYERYIGKGRGCGSGPGYKPWIRVQDFASRGVVSRVKGRKSGRVHHLLSNNELAYFYILDWSESVLDIREQYPLLAMEDVMRIASQVGVKYPTDNISGFPYVMTCDFVITTTQGVKARTVKMSSELGNERVLEKLEIERRYWAGCGVDWKVVTEKEIPYRKAKNIEWLYSGQYFDATGVLPKMSAVVMDFILRSYEDSELSIADIVQTADDKFGLDKGCGLALFKQLAIKKRVVLDMDSNINLYERRVSCGVN